MKIIKLKQKIKLNVKKRIEPKNQNRYKIKN